MRLVIATILAFGLFTALAPGASARIAQTEYELGTGPAVETVCDDERLEGLGGGCIAVEGDDAFATITVTDDVAVEVGAFYVFETADGGELTSGAFCDVVAHVHVPDHAARLKVTVAAPGVQQTLCPRLTAVPMSGTITARFFTE